MSKAAVNISLNKYEPSICLLHLEHFLYWPGSQRMESVASDLMVFCRMGKMNEATVYLWMYLGVEACKLTWKQNFQRIHPDL